MERQLCSTPRHTPSHACQRRKIAELAYALLDERRGRTRAYLRSGNVRLRKQRWKRNCAPPRGIRHRTHVNDARSMNLRMRCLDERRGRKRPYLRYGNVRWRKQRWKRNCVPPRGIRHRTHVQRRKFDALAYALPDERRGRTRPYLRSGNVRLREQRWKRNCATPRGIRHRTRVNDARSMNLRMRCLMSGAVASGRIYALGMYA